MEKIIDKIKKSWKLIIKSKYIKKYSFLILLILSLLTLDIGLRLFTNSFDFYKIYEFCPNLFTLLWIITIISFTMCLKSKWGKTFYIVIYTFFIAMFLTNALYFSYFKNYFDFKSLAYTSEASEYLMDVIKNCPLWIILVALFSLILTVLGIKFMPKKETTDHKIIPIITVILIMCHLAIPYTLGKAVNSWDSWRNPRNVYVSFNDNKRSMQVAGFYEYTIRNFYVNYLRPKISNKEINIGLVNERFAEDAETYPYITDYTGLFKDKNLILLQLESIDTFLVNEEIMPTLASLRNNAFNFKNHYSFVSGGGSTFNSEYMVNTGYTTPIAASENAYTFSKNTYNYSLPNLFKKEGYKVNAFHMNSPEYYSRDVNYKSFGYDNYYSLKSQGIYKDNAYYLDTELIKNEEFNKLIFDTENKFVNQIITYSAHVPYETKSGVCNLLVEDPTIELTEFECLKLQAKETDDMIKLLLENLEEKGLLENTIIVAYADHYLYTLNDKSLLNNYKDTSNNLINHTDLLIWGKGLKKKDITKVTSQLNIMPTIANLFGLDYHPNYYIGKDALNPDYQSLVFFNDYSWYDGNVYVENNEVTNGKYIDEDKLNETNELVSGLIKINDTVIESDYFKILETKK